MTRLSPTTPPCLPIGQSYCADIRLSGPHDIDETMWIAAVLDRSATVMRVPRPRSFGQTLSLAPLRSLLEHGDNDRTDLIADRRATVLTTHMPNYEHMPNSKCGP
jgi:hypothetical protein